MARRPRIPEPEPPETDPELEQIIAELIERKYAAKEGSAEYRLAVRELAGLRHTRELGARLWKTWTRLGGALCALIPTCLIQKERCCHCSARDAGDEPVLTKL
jgi:hypothetical protein